MEPNVQILDWGLVDYKEAWDRQTDLHQSLVKAKREQIPLNYQGILVLCEHHPVYTLGKSGSEDNLLIGPEERASRGLQYYKINRGGDITHHGPGQLVGYPILDLEYWYRDVHRYVRNIEEVIIQTLAKFGVEGFRLKGFTGVWTKNGDGEEQKICAIGVHLSRWVSMHGFALNVANDLSLFQHIIPCGIKEEGKSITSIKHITQAPVTMEEVKSEISATFARVFECNIKIIKEN